MSRFITKRTQGNLDVLKLSRELESEGVEVSNEKLNKVVSAIKSLLFKVLKQSSQSVDGQTLILQQLSAILAERCSFKEKMINAIVA